MQHNFKKNLLPQYYNIINNLMYIYQSLTAIIIIISGTILFSHDEYQSTARSIIVGFVMFSTTY
jgi:cytochrome b subunit of formate dehydrogenase